MFKLKRLLFFFLSVILPLIFLALPCISLAADEGETLTITTYYPSPYGSYNQLYVKDKLGIGTTSPQATLDVSGTDAIKIPVGTTAQRPASPANGMMRLNTTTGRLEYYNDAWLGVLGISSVAATGGTVTDVGGYRIHTFTSNGTLTVLDGGTVSVFLVGGGGGGEIGGGGGGYTATYSNIAVTAGNWTVTVGDGGLGSNPYGTATDGGQSKFSRGATEYTANGGKGAHCTGANYEAGNGGSGGGAGGAGAGGSNGSNGGGTYGGTGQGTTTRAFGDPAETLYSGGGGGGNSYPGGAGGGGNGVYYPPGGAGGANTGGGGGGIWYSWPAGNGGTGIVIVRYPIGQ